MEKDKIIKGILDLDGKAAYNRDEPSSGDLERISSENSRLVNELQKASERIRQYQKEGSYLNTRLKNLEAKIKNLSLDNAEYAVLLIKAEEERDQLKADLAEAEKVIHLVNSKRPYMFAECTIVEEINAAIAEYLAKGEK